MTAAQWREDIQFFADNAPLKHKNLYHATSPAEFAAAIRKFRAAIPSMSPEQIVVEFMRVGAMIEDAHSGVSIEDIALPQMPVHFVQFDDGVYVEAADPAHADLVGARVVNVGSDDWKTALQKVDALVNFYGDPVEITLPNSHIPIALSTLYWQDKDPRDGRTATAPEIAVPQTFAQFTSGEDPALHIALTEHAPLSVQQIAEQMAPQGASALRSAIDEYVRNPRHVYVAQTEASLNRAGYDLLRKRRVADAVTVFQVNADDHPRSANAFDSLGEGLDKAGEKIKAAEAYRRSIALNPGNSHARDALERLSDDVALHPTK